MRVRTTKKAPPSKDSVKVVLPDGSTEKFQGCAAGTVLDVSKRKGAAMIAAGEAVEE